MAKTEERTKNRDRFIPMPGINRFPERLRVAMNGLTNVALAERSGLSESAIRSYLNGRSYPGIDKIEAISAACDTPLIWLMTGECVAIKNEDRVELSDSGIESVLALMNAVQKEMLAKAVIAHGVSGIIAALNGMAAIAEFMQIPEKDRERVMRLYSQIKEGDSEGDQQSAPSGPVIKQRQAS